MYLVHTHSELLTMAKFNVEMRVKSSEVRSKVETK